MYNLRRHDITEILLKVKQTNKQQLFSLNKIFFVTNSYTTSTENDQQTNITQTASGISSKTHWKTSVHIHLEGNL